MKWTQEQLAEISAIQEKRSLSRKGAVQFLRRQLKTQGKTAPAPAAPESGKPVIAPATPTTTLAPRKLAKKAAKAMTRGRKQADAVPDVPQPAFDTTIELRPVAESLAYTAVIRGKRSVVCFYHRNRQAAANRFYSVTIRPAIWEAAKKLAAAESLPLFVGVKVTVNDKLDQGYLLTADTFKAQKRNDTDMMLTPIARAAYAGDKASVCGVRFVVAK